MKSCRYFLVDTFFNSRIGRRLFIPCYHIAALLTCRFIEWRFPSIRAWSRNSLKSDDLVPGLSDIDLTLVSHYDLPQAHESFIKEIKILLKKIIPVIGEWNFYYKSDISILRKNFNRLELDRDPQLKEYFTYKSLDENPAEIQAYLLRQWRSDKHYLEKIPMLRKRKWSRIAMNTGVEFPAISKESIRAQLQIVISESFEDEKMEICFFPHEWIGKHWGDDNLESRFEKLQLVENKYKNICEYQIRWEICGILCQLPFLDNPHEMSNHFSHLKKMISSFADHMTLESLSEIQALIEYRYSRP